MTKISKTVHNVGKKEVVFKRDLSDSALIEVGIYILKPGENVKKHFHETKDESYFILSGNAEIIIDDNKKIYLTKYEHFFVKNKTYHSLSNSGKCNLMFTIHHIENKFK